MPLNDGCSPDAISGNIAKLMEEGRERKQAVAIAYEHARKQGCDVYAQISASGELQRRVYEPGEAVLVNVQLEHVRSPDKWVSATVVEHYPDEEGEMWDEDDYLVEWSDKVPDDDYVRASTTNGRCVVPESWVNPA